MVTDADQWIEPFATTGCARLAFHLDSTASVSATIKKITQGGMKAGIALKLDDAVEGVEPYAAEVDRVLVMGTALGIKGVEPDLRACEHVKGTVALRNRCQCSFDIFVDGGIRRHTVPEFALAGADGVIPGSLVLGDGDPNAVLNWIRNLAGTARSETA
jgi:ribulose-phosphate 3-epimerase